MEAGRTKKSSDSNRPRADDVEAATDVQPDTATAGGSESEETYIYVDLSDVDVNLTPGTKLQIEVQVLTACSLPLTLCCANTNLRGTKVVSCLCRASKKPFQY